MKSQKQINLWRSGIIQALKWTTMCFACLMTFSLGIFLGKKWSDTSVQSMNGTSIQLGSHPKEALSKEPEELEDIQLKEFASEKTEPTNTVTSTTNSSERNPSSNSENIQNNTKEVEKKKLQPSSESEDSSSYNDLPSEVIETLSAKYTIQLGLYKQEKEAMSYLDHLKNQGIDAFYMSFTNDGDQTLYRVSSGVYSDKTLANNELQRILKTTPIEKASVKEIL